jgi:hypothetical protein
MRIEKENLKIRNPQFNRPMLFAPNPAKGGTPGHDLSIPQMSIRHPP